MLSNNETMFGGTDVLHELKTDEEIEALMLQDEDGEAASMIDGGAEDTGPSVNLDDFQLMAVLGRGGFGKVMQVRFKQTGKVYAMKVFHKSELRRRRQVDSCET